MAAPALAGGVAAAAGRKTTMKGRQLDLFENPLVRARRLKAERQYRQAELVLRGLVEREPENVSARASLADLYYRSGRLRQALALAAEILRRDPDEPRALVVTGNVLRKRGKPADAAENFRLALQVAETDYLWLRLAACQLDLKQPRQALESLQRAEQLAAPSLEMLRLRLRAARQLGDEGIQPRLLDEAAQLLPAEPSRFASGLVPLLAELPPRRAAFLSERLRADFNQGGNADLLLFEADNLLRARQPQQAAQRLRLLAGRELTPEQKSRLEKLLKRINRNHASSPSG
ncbi:MAG: hypothetical protein DRI34_00080 [Deltaproteobacteria bacterium]|nr:MAG: hypothetical protein DRI34_00080 [Deltaproteobacteria bacterium]